MPSSWSRLWLLNASSSLRDLLSAGDLLGWNLNVDSSLGDIAGVSGAHDRRARAAPLPDVLARRTICWCIRRLLKRFGSRFLYGV